MTLAKHKQCAKGVRVEVKRSGVLQDCPLAPISELSDRRVPKIHSSYPQLRGSIHSRIDIDTSYTTFGSFQAILSPIICRSSFFRPAFECLLGDSAIAEKTHSDPRLFEDEHSSGT
jgi:hypothetical protein